MTSKSSNADKLHVVDATAPDSLGLKLHIKKALANADAREYAILSHENLHRKNIKKIKGVIRARFSIPLIIELAIGKKDSHARFWEIPESDVHLETFFDHGFSFPESWIKGESEVLYRMCVSDGVPVEVFRDMSGKKGSFASMVINIAKLKSIYNKK